MQTVEFCV